MLIRNAAVGQRRRHAYGAVLKCGALSLSKGRASTGEPSYAQIQGLADPQFQGQWWILGLTLTSMLFNYLLGEELLFHGVLLPRMAGVFGRWDWVANTVLFGLYYVHKIWFWPSMIASSFGYAWAAKRFRSLWMSMIVHGIEGYFIVLVVAVLAGWYP
jgi:membrane protease YdiL (CAAX protease family)